MTSTQLRSAWQLIVDAWQLYRTHFNIFVQPVLIIALLSLAALLPEFYTFPYSTPLYILLVIALVLVSIWISIVFAQLIDKLSRKEKIALDVVYKDSYARSPRFLWISVVVGLIVLGGFLLLIIPGIIFSVWYAFAALYIALEARTMGIGETLKASKNIVMGRWWGTVWRLVAPQIFFSIILYIIAFGIVGIASAGQITIASSMNNIWMNALIALLSALFNPLMIATSVFLFRDLQKTARS